MPKIVDHDEQREKFAQAAMSLIARHGMEGVTMRAVAAEAKLSYGSLFHYFDSKDDLLLHAVDRLMSMQTKRFNEYVIQHSGLKALEHLLCDDAIINETSRDSWMIWMTFLYKAALQSTFAERNTELINGWLGRITGLLKDAQDSGEVSPDVDISLEALAVWAYAAGIWQLGLLHPNRLPAKRQRQLITTYLDKLRP